MSIEGALAEPISDESFGRLVGISRQAVADHRGRGLLREGASAGDWLRSYCDRLRGLRSADEAQELARQRARQAAADANLKELAYFERIGALVAVEDIEPRLASWAVAIRAEFESAIDKILGMIESKHGIELDRAAVDALIESALDAAAAWPSIDGTDANDDRGSSEGGGD
jgi:hypothetical protein